MDFKERMRPLRAPADAERGSSTEKNEGKESDYLTFLRERGFPKLKELNISMFYGRHVSEDDAIPVIAALKNADVFVPEFAAHKPGTEAALRKVALGEMTVDQIAPEHNIRSPFWHKVLVEGVHNSGVHIGIADPPFGSPEANAIVDKLRSFLQFEHEIIQRQWSRKAAQQIFGARLQRFLEANIEREKYLIKNLGDAIARSFEGDATASERTELRVLLFMGANHAAMSEAMRSSGAQVEDIFQEGERTLSYIDEIFRNFRAGLPITDAEKDAHLTESLVDIFMSQQSLSLSPSEYKRLQRKIVDSMDDAEREAFHNLCRAGDSEGAMKFLQKKEGSGIE